MTRPAHLARAPGKRAKATPAAPSIDYPPGHFVQPVRRASAMHPYGWPPGGASGVIRSAVRADGLTPSESATKAIDDGRKAGKSYATGTIPMRGTPKLAKAPGAAR